METRQLIAYVLMALLGVAFALLGWRFATRKARDRRRARTMRDRWLGQRRQAAFGETP